MRDYARAMKDSATARRNAVKAFFDPTMVGMMYFPDEHKLAIYVPLFVPLLFPLISRFFKEIKYQRTKPRK